MFENILIKIGTGIATGIATAGLFLAGLFGYQPVQQEQVVEPNIQEETQEETLGAVQTVGGKGYTLYGGGIDSDDTSITLTSFTLPVSGVEITMSNFGEIGYVTIEPGSASKQEFVSFTGITANSDETVTLTGVSRGLLPISPYTASTTYAKSHPGGSIVVISNPPQLYSQVTFKENDETVSGSWAFPTPISGSNAATKAYVDSVVNGGTLSYDQIVIAGTAGETVATGTIIYLKASDSRWYKADNDVTSTYVDQELGIAQGAGATAGAISGGVLTYGLDSTQVGMTGGNFIFLSATAGATSTATTSQILGKAISATTMFFDQNLIDSSVYVPTTFSGATTFTGTTTLSGMTYGGFYATATASTTFTGASSPQAAFITASGTASTSMSSATSTAGFSGFAVTSVSVGGTVKIQTEGIVSGFSGLTKGVTYYTTTSNGIIGTTFTVTSVPVGIAISGTELLIQKGKRIYQYTSPTLTDSGNAEATVVTVNINPNFIPRTIRIFSPSDPASAAGQHTSQEWVSGTLIGNAGMYYVSSITTPTVAGFTATITQGATAPVSSNLYMVIEE